MDEPSEILNSSNSNLREMIVQKLSAAREQKLKQNGSVSTIPPTSKSPPIKQSTSNPTDEEKQLLLTMLEKSQNSANQATQHCRSLEKTVADLNDRLRVLSNENQGLKSEIEKFHRLNPKAKNESLILEEVKKLENLSNEREKQYKEEIKNLNQRVKVLLENQETSNKNEAVQLEERISNLFEAIKDKDKEIERLKKQIKVPVPSNNEKALNNALNELRAEKQKIERNFERTFNMACEKEAELSDEIVKLKTIYGQLQEQKTQREKELKDQISLLTQEISQLKITLSENKKNAAQEREKFESEKNELKLAYQILRKDIKSSEAFSTFYTLKGDLQRAQETIACLESTVQHLKESSMPVPDSPLKEKVPDTKSLIQNIQKDFLDFYARFKSSEDSFMSELVQKNSELSSLMSEISDLRHKILIFENKKYENELVLVRNDLHKAVAERAHAKRLLVYYIRSVQHLEKTLSEKLADQDIQTVYSNEVMRLNEENKSLVEAKIKQEQFFEKEIRNLQEVIDGLHEKIQDTEMKLDASQKLRVKENTEEMKSWIIRNKQLQELNKRLVEGFAAVEQKTQNTQPAGRKKGANPKEVLRIH